MAAFQENHKRIGPILENPTPENPMQLNKDILNTDLLNKEKRNTDIQNTLSLPFRSPNYTPFDGKTVPQPEWKQTD